jgi:serine/threonine-protein kinase
MTGSQSEAAQALIDAVLFQDVVRLDRSRGEIAGGGMATIELAVDLTLGRRVALKLLRAELQPHPFAVRSFLREAQITGQLDHPNIVPIHELGVDADGRLFFTMKLIEGRTLHALLEELRTGPERLDARGLRIGSTLEHEQLLPIIEVFLKVLDAVAFAHSRGVVHCDIKPENVMVGDFGQVYLMDWGIAKLLEVDGPRGVVVREPLRSLPEEANAVIGTPAYMSPEQAFGERHRVDRRTDIFQLGALLFEILVGHPPYQGISDEEELELARACKSMILPHLAVTRDLRRIVGIATHPDPAQRFQTVEQFRAELQGSIRGGDNLPRQRFAKGDLLIREGEAGDTAYILVSGRCEVFRQFNGKNESLRTLGPGDVFGETAILASATRTSSVVALTEVLAVVVTADVLEREVDAMKPWMGSFIRALASRFGEVERRGLERPADPVQVANVAMMTLETWGRQDTERKRRMSLIQVCEAVGRICGISENAVLKILRQHAQFRIEAARDLITLVDPQGLAAELRRFVWP